MKLEQGIAWGLLLLQAALMAVFLGLAAAAEPSLAQAAPLLAQLSLRALALIAYPAMGVLILSRRAAHPIGRLFCVANVGWAINNAAGAYARYGLTQPSGALPGAQWAVWLWTWPGYFSILLLAYLFMFFPNGRLPAPRWRPVAGLLAGWAVAAAFTTAFAPGPVDSTIGFQVENPLGLAGPLGRLLALLNPWQQPLVLIVYGVVALAMVARVRSAGPLERQQLKWFASAVALLPLLLLAQLAVLVQYGAFEALPVWASWVGSLPLIAFGLMPVAAAVAILRHRLYDIDVILRRTLIYGLVTSALGLAYLASVVSLQAAVRAATGQGRSSLVTVFSTLAIVALFAPVRRRVQQAVDRRFYRQKYNAAQAAAAFAATASAEVNLEQLSARLVGVVSETLHPEHVSLWLRPGATQPDQARQR